MAKERKVARSARSGRFVTDEYARNASGTTIVERVGGTTRNHRTVYRSADTGRFVTRTWAAKHPDHSVAQQV